MKVGDIITWKGKSGDVSGTVTSISEFGVALVKLPDGKEMSIFTDPNHQTLEDHVTE